MLTLYYKPTCPFCQKVLSAAEELNVSFELKDISVDDSAAAELIERGGKRQVPFLVDEDKGVEMYESDDIIVFLKENCSGGTCGIHSEKVEDCEDCK